MRLKIDCHVVIHVQHWEQTRKLKKKLLQWKKNARLGGMERGIMNNSHSKIDETLEPLHALHDCSIPGLSYPLFSPWISCSPTPGNPCASNPCMNGGMCVSDKGHHFTCRCQQAWTGPTCNQGRFVFSPVWWAKISIYVYGFKWILNVTCLYENVQISMSVRRTPALLGPGVWTREAPSAVNVRLASTWRTDAPAREVQPLQHIMMIE